MQKKFRYLSTSDIQKETVVVRADLDIPVSDGSILDNSKLKAIVPTINYLLEKNCKVIVVGTHGECNGEFDDTLSLMDVRFELGRLVEKPIKFANITSCENSIKFMDFGEILMIENLAFSEDEYNEKKDDKAGYLERLIALADSFVLETFELPERSSSVRLLTKFIRKRFVGSGIENQLVELSKITEKKFTVAFGGSLNKESLEVLENILPFTNRLLLSNGIALAVLKEKGSKVGDHQFDEKLIKRLKTIINKAKKSKIEIELPDDFIVMDSKERVEKVDSQTINSGYSVKDIGENTAEKYKNIIETSENIMWIGTCGDVLQESTSLGTRSIGESITLSTPKSTYKVIIGEDILTAASKLNLKTKRVNIVIPSTQSFLHFLDGSVFDILKKFINRG